MLEEAIATLKQGERPICHSDRGFHYRTSEWIRIMTESGLTRSMSKKGCSPDNSACEAFFGRLKNEFFYGRKWKNVTLDDFMKQLDEYIIWYNESRIKLQFKGSNKRYCSCKGKSCFNCNRARFSKLGCRYFFKSNRRIL